MPNVDDVIEVSELDLVSQDVVQNIRERNVSLGSVEVREMDFKHLYVAVSDGFYGIRSSHGAESFTFQLGGKGSAFAAFAGTTWVGTFRGQPSLATSNAKIKVNWLSYAKVAATEHAKGGIPACIEFSGKGGARVLYMYMADLMLYTPDHYSTFLLVTENGVPLKAMP